MPIVDGKYTNPGWKDGSAPAISSEELNAMSNSIVLNQQSAAENKRAIESMSKDLSENYAEKDYADGIAYVAQGNVSITVKDNYDYSLTNVTSLTMAGSAVRCHGFISFSAALPIITISGFTASNGDDITVAAANEVWEFSVYPFNNNSYIIWKKWST